MRKSNWLQEISWGEVDNYLKEQDLILLPVGSTEQHSLCLPLGTDTYASIKMVEDAAKMTNVLVAPPLWFGWSPHHLAWPGTISVKPETLTAIVTEMVTSLVYHGFNRIIIVNGHRVTNLPPLNIAAVRVSNETGAYIAVVDPIYIGDTVARKVLTGPPGCVGHADELETSHMLHLYPELVDMSKANSNLREEKRFMLEAPYWDRDRVFVASTIEKYRERSAPTGGTSDSTAATLEKGEIYHKGLVDNLCEFIKIAQNEDVKVHTRKPIF